MSKNAAKATVILFCALLGALGLLHVLLPDREFSAAERRRLARFPTLSGTTLTDGAFMANLEKYLPDQFPARESFRRLKAVFETASGRQDTGGVWRKDGYLTALTEPYSAESVRRSGWKLETLRRMLGNERAYLCVIPPKDCYLADGIHPIPDLDGLTAALSPEIGYFSLIEIRDALSAESYYRTDSHWRQEKLDPVAEKLLGAMGIQVILPTEDTVHEYPDFLGVYAGQSALPCRPESLYWRTNVYTDSAVVSSVGAPGAEITSVYTPEKLTDRLDSYDVFLGGAVPIVTLENPLDGVGRELIVVRDSFGSSLIPLLIPYFRRIIAVDLRYVDARYLAELLPERTEDDGLLILLSAGVLANSAMLKIE